ncbi:MAG: SPOR domain-containing protein [Treponema sp.]|jgi:tetratricopeptide (TPR) repeat protein|nr:SPOR domain-containing protein [Treponema sp.]
MGLINSRSIILSLLIIHCSLFSVLLAQDFGPAGSFADEMQRLDAIIQDAKVDNSSKKEALSEKAQLLEITGNIEEAAQVWNKAAFIEAGKRDDEAFLHSARCFVAMGEYAEADTRLKTILLTGNDAAILKDARFLAAQVEVFREGEKGFPVLLAFLENQEYASSQPRIYYLLWNISGNEDYKTKLMSDFPKSPEAQLVQDEKTAVVPALTPMWLLFPGREQLVFSATVTEISVPEALEGTASKESEKPILLQAGLYSKQENAQAMVDRLKAKGFTGTISSKEVTGSTYWQVTLPPGKDSNETIMILKDAGFETFPVF